jgi:hypothetical protein
MARDIVALSLRFAKARFETIRSYLDSLNMILAHPAMPVQAVANCPINVTPEALFSFVRKNFSYPTLSREVAPARCVRSKSRGSAFPIR